jgi:protein-tyrosine-phosphatase
VTRKPVVLFLCTHNAGRSLAAKVLLDHYAQGRVEVRSAGSEPGDTLNPTVVTVLTERGLDPSHEYPKPLADGDAQTADVVVTMGCGDTCPYYPEKRYVDWELPDPAGQPKEIVKPIVEEIDARVRALLAELLHHVTEAPREGGADGRRLTPCETSSRRRATHRCARWCAKNFTFL